MLVCPNCKGKLLKEEKRYVCENGHSFDIAKQGYTNLLVHTQKATGDNKAMVDARDNFFKKDYYHVLKEKMLELVTQYPHEIVVDSGCGEGYYTNYINDNLNNLIYGFDMSKFALMKASRDNKKVKYFASNIFYLPLADKSADLVYSIFAPISMEENARVLKDGGIFIKVGPGPKHLYDLKKVVYKEAYLNPLKDVDLTLFEKIDDLIISDNIHLDTNEDIKALFDMTPYTHTSPKDGKERLFSLNSLDTIIEFHIEVFKKRA